MTISNLATRWPQDKWGCMALAFDLDGPTGDAMLNGTLWHKPEYFTFGGYGPYRALARLLDLLDDYQLPATFFVPAWVVENWPKQCQAIVERGHEVAYHGYRHESFYAIDAQMQRWVMEKSREIFWNNLGIRAEGFRTPSGDWHQDTPAMLVEAGVTYSSSMRGDDRPYLIQVPGFDKPLVEIPGRWEMDDYASIAYTREPNFPSGLDRTASYALTLDNWCREFDGAMNEGLSLTTLFHPKITGKPGRIMLLEQFFAHLRTRDDVWFARCREVAHWWLQEHVDAH
ncbi:polysaccharide deacetylase family protein [Rouxiella badensis]|jgi:peptidoglycan/xylan/chitin deacetylase (PgdA/CDA1 family)|uniref:Polysaccharide deacetylase n=1 Tax=Rouxiella badensis TaxID=1646377 RepID=A0A1X0WE61_9GAMM|nr:polysaccharide deacetylase [Rouxiella badensis]MCC3701968.1 polysaccharide deacetylase [Rouxiella badensis]MCC3718126.1 polysaccharide deacetylase [Rouxiella badensis]MCC3727106.1 polysaccharide deacetylase [Rouxiella badensis]MCC3731610.1 polysaccharide deacetylase [Rouxiella badensis]MCC3738545.1 polysaccharide deacetylase [Rouxiella badensis]